jgi:hypothetical protein
LADHLQIIRRDLSEEEAAAVLKELDGIVACDRYFLSPRIIALQAIRNKTRPGPTYEPLPPPKRYEPPRASAATTTRRALVL